MKIAIPLERFAHEKRVAATPETVKKYCALGAEVLVETGAGKHSYFTDEEYIQAGAILAATPQDLYRDADIVLKVQRPMLANEGDLNELELIRSGTILLALLSPFNQPLALQAYANANITSIALELIPRISRAQSMDVLSSQSNLAGYRAVLDAMTHYGNVMPMMMTSAGTAAPARVMVFGAGVAGLQAIATARRMGAIVSATDVRIVAKEQVESLGARFVMVESEELQNAETSGGYAKEMSDEFKRLQAQLISETISKQNIAICTALIPGRKAPILIDEAMVHSMKPGSVIVDLAVEQGGNCSLSEAGKVVEVDGVTIVGHLNMPSRVAATASAFYAKNVLNFLQPNFKTVEGKTSLDLVTEDEIVKATVVTRDGMIVHPDFSERK